MKPCAALVKNRVRLALLIPVRGMINPVVTVTVRSVWIPYAQREIVRQGQMQPGQRRPVARVPTGIVDLGIAILQIVARAQPVVVLVVLVIVAPVRPVHLVVLAIAAPVQPVLLAALVIVALAQPVLRALVTAAPVQLVLLAALEIVAPVQPVLRVALVTVARAHPVVLLVVPRASGLPVARLPVLQNLSFRKIAVLHLRPLVRARAVSWIWMARSGAAQRAGLFLPRRSAQPRQVMARTGAV